MGTLCQQVIVKKMDLERKAATMLKSYVRLPATSFQIENGFYFRRLVIT